MHCRCIAKSTPSVRSVNDKFTNDNIFFCENRFLYEIFVFKGMRNSKHLNFYKITVCQIFYTKKLYCLLFKRLPISMQKKAKNCNPMSHSHFYAIKNILLFYIGSKTQFILGSQSFKLYQFNSTCSVNHIKRFFFKFLIFEIKLSVYIPFNINLKTFGKFSIQTIINKNKINETND